jgi:hypothetical protein
MYQRMADLLKVINTIAQQNGQISKEGLKVLYEQYKIPYKEE